MKILMLGWELPPYNSGGLGVACFYMAKALSEQGADIDFVVPYKNKHSEIDFMNVIHATNYSFDNFNGCGAYDSSNYYKTHTAEKVAPDIYSIQEDYKKFIGRFLADKENWPDVIHAHDWLTMEIGLLAKKITGAPLISHIHATEFEEFSEAIKFLLCLKILAELFLKNIKSLRRKLAWFTMRLNQKLLVIQKIMTLRLIDILNF